MFDTYSSPDSNERRRLAGEESMRLADIRMGRSHIINGPEDARIWAIARKSEASSRMVHSKPMTGFAASLFSAAAAHGQALVKQVEGGK